MNKTASSLSLGFVCLSTFVSPLYVCLWFHFLATILGAQAELICQKAAHSVKDAECKPETTGPCFNAEWASRYDNKPKSRRKTQFKNLRTEQ